MVQVLAHDALAHAGDADAHVRAARPGGEARPAELPARAPEEPLR